MTDKQKIREMLKMQRQLDKNIMEEMKIETYPEESMKMAFFVEIGEMLNEMPTLFKHWKKTAEDNKDKALTEYVDAWCFLLSLCNHYKMNVRNVEDSMKDSEKYIELEKEYSNGITMWLLISSLCYNVSQNNIDYLVGTMTLISNKLGFTLDEIYERYLEKNKVNYERLANGY